MQGHSTSELHPQPYFLFFFLVFGFWFLGFYCGTGDGTQGRSTSALRPGPIFYTLFLKPGFMKLWRASLNREREREGDRERERERETERDREKERERGRELRLAVNPDPPVSTSHSTGITRVRHHARPEIKTLKHNP